MLKFLHKNDNQAIKTIDAEDVDNYLYSLPDGAIAGNMGAISECVLANVVMSLSPGARRISCGYSGATALGWDGKAMKRVYFASIVTRYIEKLSRQYLTSGNALISREVALDLRPWKGDEN